MQTDGAAFERATYSKVAWRLLPLLFAGYFFAILDRVNVGFAKLQMAGDLALSDAAYGFGAGVFFIGYFLFELPSNMILARVGARKWIARIMLTWGAVSCSFMFLGHMRWGALPGMLGLTDPEFSFYLLRFILGIAEAGFFPGVILYLTYWFPAARRAHAVALFVLAIPLASAFGSPISGLILQFFDGLGDLRGWQWLFFVEALPAIVLAFVILSVLPDRPRDARWLTDEERALVERKLAEDEGRKASLGQRINLWAIFTDWRIWALALADFLRGVINNTMNFWMPTLVQEIGLPKEAYLRIGLVSAIPWGLAAIAMVLWARHSDRTGERQWHGSLAIMVSMVGLLMLAWGGRGPVMSIVALTLVATGAMAWLAVFWTLPAAFLSGAAAAGGIAWINALSQLGGFVGPDMLGRLRESGGDAVSSGFALMALAALVTAGLTWMLAKPLKTRAEP